MARSLPKVCPFLVTVDLKLKWPELPSGPNYLVARITQWPELPRPTLQVCGRGQSVKVATPLQEVRLSSSRRV